MSLNNTTCGFVYAYRTDLVFNPGHVALCPPVYARRRLDVGEGEVRGASALVPHDVATLVDGEFLISLKYMDREVGYIKDTTYRSLGIHHYMGMEVEHGVGHVLVNA